MILHAKISFVVASNNKKNDSTRGGISFHTSGGEKLVPSFLHNINKIDFAFGEINLFVIASNNKN